MDEIKLLTEKVLKFRNDRNWKQFHNKKDMILSLVLEASELLEHVQWKTESKFLEDFNKNRTPVSDEIADIFYWVLMIANDLDIDLIKALENKIVKNEIKYPVDKSKNNASKYKDF